MDTKEQSQSLKQILRQMTAIVKEAGSLLDEPVTPEKINAVDRIVAQRLTLDKTASRKSKKHLLSR